MTTLNASVSLNSGLAAFLRRAVRKLAPLIAAFVFLLPVSGANLRTETLNEWENYTQAVSLHMRDRIRPGRAFLWVDESPNRVAKVRGGGIVVSAAGTNNPKEVASGLIHDWVGAIFIAQVSIEQVLPVVRDYGRYKDFYGPAVIDSKTVALSDSGDRFSMLLANRAFFRKSALDADYHTSQFRVDDRRRYSIAQTTRVQEIAEYGAPGQHALPEDEGTGIIWRLFSLIRFEERDGGVYVEIEAIALSRDVPASLRWLVEPIVRRVAKASLVAAMQQTRDAVNAACTARSSAIHRF